MRAVFLALCGLGILVAFALACMGCGVSPAPLPDAAEVDGGFPPLLPPGAECAYSGTCADGQCAAPMPTPDDAHKVYGCCVRGDVCRNAGERAVCAYQAVIANGDGGTFTYCIDCGDGRGLRCR